MTLKMTTAQVVETLVTVTNSSFQNYTHPDDHTTRTTDTPGFKPFTKFNVCKPQKKIKGGSTTLLIEIGDAEVHPSGAIFSLMKAMRLNYYYPSECQIRCSEICKHTKSEVINNPGY